MLEDDAALVADIGMRFSDWLVVIGVVLLVAGALSGVASVLSGVAGHPEMVWGLMGVGAALQIVGVFFVGRIAAPE